MFWFATASLMPVPLIVLACTSGGIFPALAVLSITVLVFFMDKLARDLPEGRSSGRGLSVTLALVHFPLLFLGVWALAGQGDHGVLDRILIFTALGLFAGQISNSNAHELIHAATRLHRRLGAAVYVSLLHGHHVSAHLQVHHVHAATDADPNSARRGEGFWRYAARVLKDEFVAGLRAETVRRARANLPVWRHPYLAYVAGGLAMLAFSVMLAGPGGALAHLGIAAYAQLQLLLSDYVQHYGLRRRTTPSGKPEPIGPEHSWNVPNWYSSAMMLNAPRHSDHHVHPARPFPALRMEGATMPVLPHSLPVMAVIALLPPLWRRVMDPRVARWQKTA